MNNNRRDLIRGAMASIALSGVSATKAFGADEATPVSLPLKLPLKSGDTLEIKGITDGKVNSVIKPKDSTVTTPTKDGVYELLNGGRIVLDTGKLDEDLSTASWVDVDFNLHVKSPKSDKIYGPEYLKTLNENTELMFKTKGVETLMKKPSMLDPKILEQFESIHGIKK